MINAVRLFVMIAAFLLPSVASAHTQFRDSQPVGNAVVLDMPETVVLEFNEPVSPIKLRWIAPDGSGGVIRSSGNQSGACGSECHRYVLAPRRHARFCSAKG